MSGIVVKVPGVISGTSRINVGTTSSRVRAMVEGSPAGAQGIGIKSAIIEDLGDERRLKVTLSTNEVIDAGIVSARVVASRFNENNEFIMTYSDGSEVNAGVPQNLVNATGLGKLQDDLLPTLGGDLRLNGFGILPAEDQTLIFDGGDLG
jgi:hypothetical protein